ncbi:pathogenesis-related thaumatin-like protein 3.5 [Corylus avellana]|uniref:pathogenesis-related thaumatin-like protein 3.5 n=1 Tax=Corylus avellana TaxID=13451 RepID=UPI001E201CB8|nr:pathogenesis-related thaumatin-like protein 3.5 [Corylus avellana]
MKLPELVAAFSVFLVWHFQLSAGNAAASQIAFYVHNKCPFPIWPATASNVGYPVIADGGFNLSPGQTQRIYAPLTWSGRIWARTGCKFTANPACDTGDCDGRLACKGLIGTPPATLVEISAQEGKPTFYDVSLVDGYNIPVSVCSKQLSPSCIIKGCSKNVNSLCPQELQVLNKNGEVVACKSGCLAFDLDKFCCRNEYGSPGKCKASVYSKIFKDACPSYYSFAFDMPPPLVNCSSREYVITFCPSGSAYAST